MKEKRSGRIILTSRGLTVRSGFDMIKEALKRDNLPAKKIALIYEPYFSIEERLKVCCRMLGFQEENIYLCGPFFEPSKLLEMDYIYVTEGNTFEVLDEMRKHDLCDYVREAVHKGASYIGTSAGAVIAGCEITPALSMDLNFVQMKEEEMKGLCLFDGVVFPHTERKKLEESVEAFGEKAKSWNEIFSVGNDEILILE